MYTYISYSIRLPVSIVDLVDADDVRYGEVFILDMDDTVANEESQGCTTVTLGFFHIEGIVLTNYCKYGKICWAKFWQFSQLLRVPQKFFHEYCYALYNGVV